MLLVLLFCLSMVIDELLHRLLSFERHPLYVYIGSILLLISVLDRIIYRFKQVYVKLVYIAEKISRLIKKK